MHSITIYVAHTPEYQNRPREVFRCPAIQMRPIAVGRFALGILLIGSVLGVYRIAEGRVALVDLSGNAGAPAAASWALTNANKSVEVTGFTIPAYVLEVLENAGVIPDPLQR